jgi:hypothetical protein
MERSDRKASPPNKEPTHHKRWLGDYTDKIASISCTVGVLAGVIGLFLSWRGIITLQSAVKPYWVVMAFLLSFFVVAHLRQPESPIEIRGLGFVLKGNAGRTVLWIICFLVIVGAMHLAGLL